MQTILRSSKQAGSRTFATTVFPVTDAFKKRHIGPQTGERDEMLEALGFSTLGDNSNVCETLTICGTQSMISPCTTETPFSGICFLQKR